MLGEPDQWRQGGTAITRCPFVLYARLSCSARFDRCGDSPVSSRRAVSLHRGVVAPAASLMSAGRFMIQMLWLSFWSVPMKPPGTADGPSTARRDPVSASGWRIRTHGTGHRPGDAARRAVVRPESSSPLGLSGRSKESRRRETRTPAARRQVRRHRDPLALRHLRGASKRCHDHLRRHRSAGDDRRNPLATR